MGAIASQITSLAIVFSTVYLDTDQRKHQSSASLAFVRGIHRRPVNSPHKWPVTRKMFPFDDVIMLYLHLNLTTLEGSSTEFGYIITTMVKPAAHTFGFCPPRMYLVSQQVLCINCKLNGLCCAKITRPITEKLRGYSVLYAKHRRQE